MNCRAMAFVTALCWMCVMLVSCGSAGLVGVWEWEDDGFSYQIEFKEDGTTWQRYQQYSHYYGTYTDNGDTLVILCENGDTEVFPYVLNGDSLSITTHGERVECHRVK